MQSLPRLMLLFGQAYKAPSLSVKHCIHFGMEVSKFKARDFEKQAADDTMGKSLKFYFLPFLWWIGALVWGISLIAWFKLILIDLIR